MAGMFVVDPFVFGPGHAAPLGKMRDYRGYAVMVGICWTVYSLNIRVVRAPLRAVHILSFYSVT